MPRRFRPPRSLPHAWRSTRSKHEIARAPRGAVEVNDAYAVVDVRIGYREHGRAIVENGAWTFALKNEGETWKIVVAVFAPMPTATPQTR